jgi:hypothetical protein
MMTTGCPMELTRKAVTSHCAVTHGPLPVGGEKLHPATVYGAPAVAIGIPDTVTRALGVVGMAWPPCAQDTIAPTWRMGPGTTRSPSGHQC